jgi:surface polysaccharide O-acyltransferase-like enzyme
LLRIAAIFGVIIIHVAASKWYDTSIETFNWQIINFYHSVIRWPVPIFFMISGVFFLRPLDNGIELKQELKYVFKKIFHLVCAIVFWACLYNFVIIMSKFVLKNEFVTVYDILKIFAQIIFGPAWYHLWFLYVLIGLYLLTPIFRLFIKNSKKMYLEYYLILFFWFGALLPLCNEILKHISILKGHGFYFFLPEVTGYMGYFIAGYYFANYNIKRKTKITIFTLAILSLIFTVAGTSVISRYTGLPNQYLVNPILPNTMVISFSVFIIFQQIDKRINFSNKQKIIIIDIGKSTFGIYLVHALIIQILRYFGLNPLTINPIISIPLISIAVMLVSFIGIKIIEKIPVLNRSVI